MIGSAVLRLNERLSDYQEIDLPPHRLNLDSAIVLLRLAGNVSLSGISDILQMQGYSHYSASVVSQHLKDFGSRLPILVTIDPVR